MGVYGKTITGLGPEIERAYNITKNSRLGFIESGHEN